jgi:hypothetical protein
VLGLRDAGTAVTVEDQEQGAQGEHHQQLHVVVARGIREQEAERRDAGVDQPDDGDDAELEFGRESERAGLAQR